MTPAWPSGPSFLLHATVTGGLGRSMVGLDRGEVGPSLLCRADQGRADRDADAVVVTACNAEFGHSGDTPAERAAAARSFAESALARCPATGSDAFDPAPLGLVDLVGAGRRLTDVAETPFVLDPDLSRLDRVEWYGDVLAVESVLTFRAHRASPRKADGNSPVVGPPAPLVRPAPADTVSVRQQVTLRPLPPPGFEPRRLDPTAGATANLAVHRFDDIADRDAETPLATRFRAVEPIVFHLDPAMPPAVRDAVLTGGNWWQEAFAAAGLPGRYRVEPLPEGAELTDPRLNVVLWVHRADRGWSMGMTQLDPRTGEILRAVVRLGSQRIEQLRAITESVLAPYSSDDGVATVAGVVAARLRQLAAHEIGHGLGLAHNFASHRHERPSVMDYPGPLFELDGDRPVAPTPYATGPGPWDLHQISALYGSGSNSGFPNTDFLYVTDADARADDAADSCGATWIAPREPVAALRELLAIREAALRRFGPAVVPPGSDPNELERRFLVLYLLHRHQATAVAKLVGGSRRRYAVTGGATFAGAATPVPVADQRVALDLLAALLTPEFLAIPSQVRPLLVGPAGGRPRREGQFDNRTAGAFDVTAAVSAGADVVAGTLLAPARLNRLGSALDEVLAATVGRAVELLSADNRNPYTEAIGWTVLRRFEHSVTSSLLHHQTRVAAVETVDAWLPDDVRPALAARWKALTKAAYEHPAELPDLPPGTPI